MKLKSIAGLISVGALTLFLASVPVHAQDAAATFKAKCAMCHGADGKGETPVGKKMGVHSFAAPEVQGASDADLSGIIEKGKNKMPAYAGKLSAAEIKGLVAYVKELGKK